MLSYWKLPALNHNESLASLREVFANNTNKNPLINKQIEMNKDLLLISDENSFL